MTTHAHSDKCTQLSEIITKEFETIKVEYCPECFKYVDSKIECDHNFIKVAFKIANGATQVKDYCIKCREVFGSPYPQSKFNMNELKRADLDKYWEFRNRITHEDFINVRNFKEWLFIKSKEVYKSEYHEYLSTDMWNNKRQNILERDNNTCQICGKMAECVHHLTYANVYHEYNFELISLCNDCHKTYHQDKNTNIA